MEKICNQIKAYIQAEMKKDHPDTVSDCGMFYQQWNSFVISLNDLGYDLGKLPLKESKQLLEDIIDSFSKNEWFRMYYELPTAIDQPSFMSMKRRGKDNEYSIIVQLNI